LVAGGHQSQWRAADTRDLYELRVDIELTLSLEGKARHKALAEARRLQKEDVPA